MPRATHDRRLLEQLWRIGRFVGRLSGVGAAVGLVADAALSAAEEVVLDVAREIVPDMAREIVLDAAREIILDEAEEIVIDVAVEVTLDVASEIILDTAGEIVLDATGAAGDHFVDRIDDRIRPIGPGIEIGGEVHVGEAFPGRLVEQVLGLYVKAEGRDPSVERDAVVRYSRQRRIGAPGGGVQVAFVHVEI